MTNDQIRRKIAEACWWTNLHIGKSGELWGEFHPTRGFSEVPNYPESHDAMAEALGTLDVKQQNVFLWSLAETVGWAFTWNLITATPIQKAEAFLKANGLWEEGE